MERLVCSLFGHRYKLIRRVTNIVREVECTRCKAQFGMNDEVRAILPLDDDLKRAHGIIGK